VIRSFGGKTPRVAETAWVSEAAYVVGDVEIGDGSSVWPHAVVRGDFSSIRIGANSHIEDCCVVHTGEPLVIGDNVTAGHGVVIHCRRVGHNVLLGNNSTILDGAEVGDFTIVAAGAVVTPRTVVPQGSFLRGVPATIEPIEPARLERLRARGSAEGGYAAMVRRYREAGL
jgi:carbonic anhydrase/acetyltransferase-like protein (isoleucine patch superfamily)